MSDALKTQQRTIEVYDWLQDFLIGSQEADRHYHIVLDRNEELDNHRSANLRDGSLDLVHLEYEIYRHAVHQLVMWAIDDDKEDDLSQDKQTWYLFDNLLQIENFMEIQSGRLLTAKPELVKQMLAVFRAYTQLALSLTRNIKEAS